MALAAAACGIAAESSVPPAKSPGDLAFDAARAAINTAKPEAAKVLDAGFNLFFNFPDHAGTSGLLPAMGGITQRLPEAERAGYTKAFNERLAAELAKPTLPDAAREGILGAQASIELNAQTRAEKPDVAALRTKLDALAARFPKARQLAGLELGYAKLLAKADPVSGWRQSRRLGCRHQEWLLLSNLNAHHFHY